ncbi:MAG: hypothetical protein QM811_18775 [Pirellulales bacterium]
MLRSRSAARLALLFLVPAAPLAAGEAPRSASWRVEPPAIAPPQVAPAFVERPRAMELPADVRAWFRNPDGSCVQCSIGMCGVWSNVPAAGTLLWDTPYGRAERGGAWPSRTADYARRRGIALYNVTGATTLDWLAWAGRTGRYAAFAAGTAHFQTLYGYDPAARRWSVCNNNSTARIDRYDDAAFRRLHRAGGAWCVILDAPPSPAVPEYRR